MFFIFGSSAIGEFQASYQKQQKRQNSTKINKVPEKTLKNFEFWKVFGVCAELAFFKNLLFVGGRHLSKPHFCIFDKNQAVLGRSRLGCASKKNKKDQKKKIKRIKKQIKKDQKITK